MGADGIAGRYRLVERIGVGAMSEVWRAEDLELGRTVAVKLLRPEADRARFEREARAVAGLSHPNVNQLFDFGELEGRPYMVLEYLPGGSLHERLRPHEPLPDPETERVAMDIAAGLAHTHGHGLVHRDLKPANVLFDLEGRAKLADFGIARLEGAGTLTEAGTVLGTAAYISPEQASGQPVTPASDVYSFGVILFRLLTGRPPFEAPDPMTLATMHVTRAPPAAAELRADLPPALASLADACLAKDPARRPRDGAALVRALAAGGALPTPLETAATAPIAAVEATRVLPRERPAAVPGEPPPRPPRGRGTIVAAVAGLVLLAAAGVVVGLLTTRSGSPASPATRSTRQHTTARSTGQTEESTALSSETHEQTTTARPTTRETSTSAPTTTAPPTTTPSVTLPTSSAGLTTATTLTSAAPTTGAATTVGGVGSRP